MNSRTVDRYLRTQPPLTGTGQRSDLRTITRKSGQSDWNNLMSALTSGATVLVAEDIYHYFLEVLPPKWMGHIGSFVFCEGLDRPMYFWCEKGVYYGRTYPDWATIQREVDPTIEWWE